MSTNVTGKHEKDDDGMRFPAPFGFGDGSGSDGDFPTEGEMTN